MCERGEQWRAARTGERGPAVAAEPGGEALPDGPGEAGSLNRRAGGEIRRNPRELSTFYAMRQLGVVIHVDQSPVGDALLYRGADDEAHAARQRGSGGNSDDE